MAEDKDPAVEAAWREVFEAMDPHSRAGETKKRRTREKLIHACDYVMREQGMSAKVEAIAEEAGVSVPTFYNFYSSRNRLCLDALKEVVFKQLRLADRRDFRVTADLVIQLCDERAALVQAAFIWMLSEEDQSTSHYYDGDLTGQLAHLLADEDMQTIHGEGDVTVARLGVALNMAATVLLIGIAKGAEVDTALLEDIVRLASGLEPRA